MKTGIAVTGYPGAGKSLVGEFLEEKLGGEECETGDIVRRGAARHFECSVDELSSDELGDYSTMRRKEDGGDYVIQDVFDNLRRNPGFPMNPAIITGMRDSEVPNLCEEFFDNFLIVWVEASFGKRLERIQDRGRQDEDSFDEENLRKRDSREDDWGTGRLYTKRDVVIKNDDTIPTLSSRLNAIQYLIQ
jgi:dephospho-CoA kinase